MGLVGVSVTKTTSFRGVAQEFGNTYYYSTPLGVSAATAETLLDNIVALEKPMHANTITFVRGRVWTAGGTNAQNQMLVTKNLSGNGTNASGALGSMDKERAFLVRFRAGSDSRGNPVYLRKWWHLDISGLDSVGINSGHLQNTAALNGTQRAQLVTWANQFKSVTAGAQNFDLKGPTGRSIDGDTVAHQYLEHHQLGDMWRG